MMTMMTMMKEQNRNQNKIWQQLPRDLLHCVYSEWLSWSDLSVLDISCLGEEDREEWLSSLSSLMMTEALSRWCNPYKECSIEFGTKLISYYKWLGRRNVLVRNNFLVLFSAMEDLLLYCDPMIFCPAIHSILIVEERFRLKDYLQLKSRLSSFFGHCSHLKGVTVKGVWFNYLDNKNWSIKDHSILFASLNNILPDNTLKEINIAIYHKDEMVASKIDKLISKHMKSLKELKLYAHAEVLDLVLKHLIQSRRALQGLELWSTRGDFTGHIPSLFQYLTLAGMSLETLGLPKFDISDELLISIGTFCPKLQRLLLWKSNHLSTPSIIYHLCPNFRTLRADNFNLEVDDNRNSVHLDIDVTQQCQRFLEDCMECLCLVLQRGQYRQLGLTVSGFLDDDEWTIVKTKVGAKLTSLHAKMLEEVLIELLRDLPRLQVLNVKNFWRFKNASLLAITEHGQDLIELTFHADIKCVFTDDMISHMIRRCRKLEVLSIPCAGCESILCAAQHLPRLREVTFGRVGMSKEAIMDLLDNEEVRWPSSLRRGIIESKNEFRLLYNQHHGGGWV